MIVQDTILDIIETEKVYPCPANGKSNLYTDLGFDSLSFVRLVVKIEDAFSVTFGIAEIQKCLQVDDLISAVEKKLAKGGRNDD